MITDSIIIKIDVKTHTCVVCKQAFKPNRFTKQAARNLCATDDFWYDKTLIIDDADVARIGGQHYIIGPPNRTIRGTGGRKFTIKFSDGRVVTTDNLWHQGTIPEAWRDWLFDNAEFKEA